MPTMHIQEELDDRMIALGYVKRAQRRLFVNEAIKERLEREKGEEKSIAIKITEAEQ